MACWSRTRCAWATLHLAATATGVCCVSSGRQSPAFRRLLRERFPECSWREDPTHPVLAEAVRQLEAYLAGNLRQFSLPLDLRGTPFQRLIWRETIHIPYGETRTYQQLAGLCGRPRAMRAVGNAMSECMVGIVVPCHRVVSAAGIGGYGSQTSLKRRLLDLEGAWDFKRNRPTASQAKQKTRPDSR